MYIADAPAGPAALAALVRVRARRRPAEQHEPEAALERDPHQRAHAACAELDSRIAGRLLREREDAAAPAVLVWALSAWRS